MSAAITAKVLAYCAGAGVLQLRRAPGGSRPVLVIRRCESQKSYLDHQLRALRKLHDGPLRAVIDRGSGSGFYDVLRLKAASDQFSRAYGLLYPTDGRNWTPQLARLSGEAGLVNLWLDHGRWISQSSAVIKPPWRSEEMVAWIEALHGHGVRCAPKIKTTSGEIEAIALGVSGTEALVRFIRPHVHRTMRERLWPRKMLASGHVLPH